LEGEGEREEEREGEREGETEGESWSWVYEFRGAQLAQLARFGRGYSETDDEASRTSLKLKLRSEAEAGNTFYNGRAWIWRGVAIGGLRAAFLDKHLS
jgi:hypothetical protein